VCARLPIQIWMPDTDLNKFKIIIYAYQNVVIICILGYQWNHCRNPRILCMHYYRYISTGVSLQQVKCFQHIVFNPKTFGQGHH
jgi:hypothetical protein